MQDSSKSDVASPKPSPTHIAKSANFLMNVAAEPGSKLEFVMSVDQVEPGMNVLLVSDSYDNATYDMHGR